MRVLFLAYGATRSRTVAAESAEVLAHGGEATVLIEWPAFWGTVEFAPGVEVVHIYQLERWRLARQLVDLILFRVPGFIFYHLARGRAERQVRRFGSAYRHRIARPTLDRIILPVYRRLWRGARERLFARRLDGRTFDMIVISDPASIPEGLTMAARVGDGDPSRLSYRMDFTPTLAVAAGR
jgi:hypothetical protein